MTLHPCCPDTDLVIDGLYGEVDRPIAAAWTCKVCGSSGGTLWHLAPAWMRAEAIEKDMRAKREAGLC